VPINRSGFAVVAVGAHQQVLAEGIEHVDVVAGRRTCGTLRRAPISSTETRLPKRCGLANVFFIASPNHIQPVLLDAAAGPKRFAAVK